MFHLFNFLVIKTRIQTTNKAPGEKTYSGILDCAM